MIRPTLMLLLTAALLQPADAAPQSRNDIVDTAIAAKTFQTLVAALKAADLVDALRSKGPFTVFAPTDEAFAKLPRGTIATLLKPENRGKLRAILNYHVVPGRLVAADLLATPSRVSANGASIPVSFRDGRIGIQKASLVVPDIPCQNGVIHVIDSVLLPPKDGVLDVAKRAGKFNTLLAAIRASGLEDTLRGSGPFTVFAPTDEAFARLPKSAVADLLKPENRSKLVAILARHVVKGRVDAATALRAGSATTLGTVAISIAIRKGVVRVGVATLVSADIAAANGVVHVIDRVLLPPSPTAQTRSAAMQTLELAIERGAPEFNGGRAGACASIYEVAMRAVLTMAGSQLAVEERGELEQALARLERTRGDTNRAWLLRRAMDKVLSTLDRTGATATRTAKAASTFKPIIEADLPEGFPAPGPVGEVSLKLYPKYRAARANGRASFWTLFTHIKKNKIAMTAPVEMAVSDEGGDLKQTNMAFL
ncbi:MAG: fasciclin domain-containing protein, partial [Planctomycetota bacterium]